MQCIRTKTIFRSNIDSKSQKRDGGVLARFKGRGCLSTKLAICVLAVFSMGLCHEQAARDDRVSCIYSCMSAKDGKTEDVKA